MTKLTQNVILPHILIRLFTRHSTTVAKDPKFLSGIPQNEMIWEKLFIWENLCLWLFKISTGMQDENLRSMACHCRNEMSAQFGYHSNKDLQLYTIHFPPMKWPGHPSMTLSVAMARQLWCHSTSAMTCNVCHAPEFFILHISIHVISFKRASGRSSFHFREVYKNV